MKNLIRQTTGSVRIFYAGYLYPIQYPGKVNIHPSLILHDTVSLSHYCNGDWWLWNGRTMQVAILEYKSIICAGYSAVMHIHTCAEEVSIKVRLSTACWSFTIPKLS